MKSLIGAVFCPNGKLLGGKVIINNDEMKNLKRKLSQCDYKVYFELTGMWSFFGTRTILQTLWSSKNIKIKEFFFAKECFCVTISHSIIFGFGICAFYMHFIPFSYP